MKQSDPNSFPKRMSFPTVVCRFCQFFRSRASLARRSSLSRRRMRMTRSIRGIRVTTAPVSWRSTVYSPLATAITSRVDEIGSDVTRSIQNHSFR